MVERGPDDPTRRGLRAHQRCVRDRRPISDESRARAQYHAGDHQGASGYAQGSLPHVLGGSLNTSRAFWKSSAEISPVAKRRERMSSGDSWVATAGAGNPWRHEEGPATALISHTMKTAKPTRNNNPASPLTKPKGKNAVGPE